MQIKEAQLCLATGSSKVAIAACSLPFSLGRAGEAGRARGLCWTFLIIHVLRLKIDCHGESNIPGRRFVTVFS